MVYSAAKANPKLPLSWARTPEIGLPRPDIVLFLDVNEDEARARGGWGSELYERAEMQRRVRQLFRALAEKDVRLEGMESKCDEAEDTTDFTEERADLKVVSAAGSIDEVEERLWSTISPQLDNIGLGAMRWVGPQNRSTKGEHLINDL